MVNKQLILVILAIFGLSFGNSFGMTPPAGNGTQPLVHQLAAKKQQRKNFLKKFSQDYKLDYKKLKKMDDKKLQELIQRAENYKAEQQKALQSSVPSDEEDEVVESSSFSTGYRVVRGITVALTAAWRIHHYATKVCSILGRNDLTNSTAMNLGSFAAAGTLATLDYFFPGKVGSFLVGTFGMDALYSNVLNRAGLPAYTSPRVG